MEKLKQYSYWCALTLVALYMMAGGVMKLAGVPQVHQGFAALGLPSWFGYFIGVCEVAGAIALFIKPLSSLAACGILVIMVSAFYYHVTYTPLVKAIPAALIFLMCMYVFFKNRNAIMAFKKPVESVA